MERIAGFDGIRGLSVAAAALTHLGVFGQFRKAGILPIYFLCLVPYAQPSQ